MVFKPLKATKIVDTYFSLSPLTYILKLFSLNCISRRNSKLYSTWPTIKVIWFLAILISFQVYDLYCDIASYMLKTYPITSPFILDHIHMTFGYLQYVLDLYFVYNLGQDKRLHYIKIYEYIDKILGFPISLHYSVRNAILKQSFSFALAWFVSSLADFIACAIGDGFLTSIFYSCDYVFFMIKMLTILDFMSQVILIEFRLIAIANILVYYTNKYESKIKIRFENQNYVESSSQSVDVLKIYSTSASDEISWILKCYLILIEQTSYINQMYGLRILSNSISLILDMVSYIALGYRSATGDMPTKYYTGGLEILSCVLRFCNGPLVFFGFVYRCEKCYRQQEKIINIVDNLLFGRDTEIKYVLQEFRDVLLSRPITFNAANFFKIDYTLLVSTASVCVTYTIILA